MSKCRTYLIGISAILLVSQVTYASSKNLESKQKEVIKERDAVSQQIKQKKNNVDETQGKVDSVQKEIDALDNQIVGVTGEITNLENEMAALNARIEKNQKELKEAEENLAEKKELFGQRVKAMYMDGKASYIEVLLNSKNMDELIRNNQIITSIAESDRKLVDYITEQVKTIKSVKEQLESDKKKLEDNKVELEIQKQNLVEKNNKKNEYMQALEKDVDLYVKEYEESQAMWKSLDSKIVELQKQIKSAKDEEARAERERIERERLKSRSLTQRDTDNDVKPSVGSRGLMWPVTGYTRISSPYGNRYHPILKTMRFHSGIDIPAPVGTPVRAVKSGTVILASSMSGYGNVVMVDHGDIVTVYAHNSVLKVRVGQRVNQGDVVSLIGNTGLSTGPHLHFEVRVNGATQNPLNFL